MNASINMPSEIEGDAFHSNHRKQIEGTNEWNF